MGYEPFHSSLRLIAFEHGKHNPKLSKTPLKTEFNENKLDRFPLFVLYCFLHKSM